MKPRLFRWLYPGKYTYIKELEHTCILLDRRNKELARHLKEFTDKIPPFATYSYWDKDK